MREKEEREKERRRCGGKRVKEGEGGYRGKQGETGGGDGYIF